MHEHLVHIAAPTTRKADDVYRSLSRAYIEFEPYQAFGDPDSSRHERENSTIIRSSPVRSSAQASTNNLGLDESKDSYGSFPSGLSSGAYSKAYNHFTSEMSARSSGEHSQQSLSRLEKLERVHVNWKNKRNQLSNALEEKFRSRTGHPSYSSNRDSVFIEDTQLAAQAIESQLPEYFSQTEEDTSEEEGDQEVRDRSLVQSHLMGLDISHSISTHCIEARSELIPASQISVAGGTLDHTPGSTEANTTLRSSPSISRPQHKLASPRTADGHLHKTFEFQSLPLEVFPPPPKISIDSPGELPSQITEYLATIRMENSDRFKPTKRLRDLDHDERGYWLVECDNWSPRAQYGFWSLLCEHVKSGKLGWGVSLHREGMQGSRGLGQVRLYSWGELVEHIWLSIWLCSQGRVVGSGSRWLDAENTIIIRVA